PKLRDYIFDSFYKNLDLCIEILREQFIRKSSGELLTIVLSDHGFESHYKQFYLGDWLFHQNLIKMKKESIFSIFRRKIIDFLFKINVSYVQTKIIRMFKNIESKFGKTPKEKSSTAFLQKMIDWKNSSVFPRGIGLYGYIFVLKEGKKKRELIESLKSSLFQIEDPENNLKIVDKIYTKDEIYKGDKPHLIPDLIIKPIKGYSFRGEFKNKKNFFEKITKKESETIGKHNEFGIIIMNSVSVLKKKIEVAHLKDIVPTILHFFQLPLPDYLDGDILNCFKP
ncbi:MAG: alkaline phosphatase family protein, partial [Candidatus Thorarchaeota archaeon]